MAQATEPTQTIDPGAILIRMDAISLGIRPDAVAPNQYKSLAVGTTIVSTGLTSTVDLEVGTQLFLQDTFSTGGSSHTESGIGDVTLRPKWTFWRDPSTGQAAAIVPYVLLPTDSKAVGNNSVQGGVILPWSMDIAAGTKAAAMVEWDELRNVANTRYDTRWYGTAYIKWDLGKTLGAYAETTLSDSTAGSSTFAGTVGAAGSAPKSGSGVRFFSEPDRAFGTLSCMTTPVPISQTFCLDSRGVLVSYLNPVDVEGMRWMKVSLVSWSPAVPGSDFRLLAKSHSSGRFLELPPIG